MIMTELLAAHLGYSQTGTQEDYYQPTKILAFADSLYNEKDYTRAAGEYLRFLFALPERSESKATVLIRIADCYRQAGELKKAVSYYTQVFTEYPLSKEAGESRYRIALSYFLGKKHMDSIQWIDRIKDFSIEPEQEKRLYRLRGLNFLFMKEWHQAKEQFASLERKTGFDPITHQFQEMAIQGGKLPLKKPVLAGLLSTLLPGMGRVYAKRPFDGLASFLSIALFSWQAYHGFHENGSRSLKGWIYGTLAGLLYLGEIYGSMISIRIYNRRLQDQYLEGVSIAIGIHAN